MYDLHCHSDFSIDTNILMEDMVLAAIEKNAKSICFTDHVEFGVGPSRIDVVFRREDYFRKVKQLKYTYAKHVEVLAGAEIGLQEGELEKCRAFVKDQPFDFVLAAIHTVRHLDVVSELIERYPPDESIVLYYEDMLSCLEQFDDFDSLAHIDYLNRYLPALYAEEPIHPDELEMIEPILQLLIDKGKSLEVNTGFFRRGFPWPHPRPAILQLYRDLGGEMITFGSDAHRPEHILYEYRQTERLLRDLGFRYLIKYKERKKYPIHLL